MKDADFRKETEMLRECLQQAEAERDNLRKLSKQLEEDGQKGLEDVSSRHAEQLEAAEKELEEKERDFEQRLEDMHRQSEDQLSQLKSFYEAEKQRLE